MATLRITKCKVISMELDEDGTYDIVIVADKEAIMHSTHFIEGPDAKSLEAILGYSKKLRKEMSTK